MIKGIGIDTVSISKIKKYIDSVGYSYIIHTFTENERISAKKHSVQEEYYAARFAVKEAVFKAVAHNTQEKAFDLRIIETLNDEDGYPYVKISGELQTVLEKADIRSIQISITTENDYATAIAIACS